MSKITTWTPLTLELGLKFGFHFWAELEIRTWLGLEFYFRLE